MKKKEQAMAKATLEVQNGELVSRETMYAVFTYNPQQLSIKYVEHEKAADDGE
jgi:hypothetical protein